MAALTTQTITAAGIVPSYGSAAGGGDTFTNTGKEFLHFKNGSGGDITVTVVASAKYKGATLTNPTAVISAGSEKAFQPPPPEVTGTTASLTYSGVTSLTVAVVQYVPI